ncbi:MAG: alpha/beta hydrolase [Bacteroidetes bacterium]|nr:alpha/beta hydrolase [Bacteroidota bacterium]
MTPLARKAGKIFLALLVLFVLVTGVLYFVQERLIFQGKQLPADFAFTFNQPFREVSIHTPDHIKLDGLLFPGEGASRGLILYFHGNRDNLQRWGKYAEDFTSLGYSVLMVDYRGYGKSTGEPSEGKLYEDAEIVLSWAQDSLKFEKLVIYGRSLGSAVASHLASVYPPDLLILETPFDDISGTVLPPFRYLLSQLPPRYQFSNKNALRQVKCKKVIIHGTNDWVVPLSSAERLRPLLGPSDSFVIIPDGGHGNLRNFPQYHELLKSLLQ